MAVLQYATFVLPEPLPAGGLAAEALEVLLGWGGDLEDLVMVRPAGSGDPEGAERGHRLGGSGLEGLQGCLDRGLEVHVRILRADWPPVDVATFRDGALPHVRVHFPRGAVLRQPEPRQRRYFEDLAAFGERVQAEAVLVWEEGAEDLEEGLLRVDGKLLVEGGGRRGELLEVWTQGVEVELVGPGGLGEARTLGPYRCLRVRA